MLAVSGWVSDLLPSNEHFLTVDLKLIFLEALLTFYDP